MVLTTSLALACLPETDEATKFAPSWCSPLRPASCGTGFLTAVAQLIARRTGRGLCFW
jgi:hypothetical protein